MDVAEDGALLSPASDSSQPPATPLQRLEECITMLIERHREICIIAKDFNEESQPLLFTKINDLVLLYRELDALKGSCDVMVPRDVIAVIDAGGNPDMYTQQRREQMQQAQANSDNRLKALSHFRSMFQQELSAFIPNAAELGADTDGNNVHSAGDDRAASSSSGSSSGTSEAHVNGNGLA